LAHPDAAVCQEQAEAHLAPYPFLGAADNHRGAANSWDAAHGAVRPVLKMDTVGAIPEGIRLLGLRDEAAGILAGRAQFPADARQGRFVAWAWNLERPA